MFDRFRRSHDRDTTVATRDSETTATETRARDVDEGATTTQTPRFERETSDPTTADTTLDRESARDDLARDDAMTADETADRGPGDASHTGGRGGAIAVGGAAAAAEHHREAERDEDMHDDALAREDAATTAHDRDDDTVGRGDTAVAPAGTVARERGLDREHDLDRDGVDDRVERHEPVLAPAAMATMRARQRDRFGGIQWGSDFFGWLCAIGLASLLTAALVGAGVALGLSTDDATNSDTAQQIGLGGGIALIAVLAIAWFCGGYVAGRMARFDGARQGIGVWAWTILAAIVVALVALIGGSDYDVYQRLNLPRLAIGDSTLNTGGAIAGAAAIVVTLLFAALGGKAGERYHRRVDRVATDEYVVEH